MTSQSQVNNDHVYMARAIQLAKKGQYTTYPNPRVGCVIVKNSEVVGEGYHHRAGEPHAEINALLQTHSVNKSAKGATAYVTLEPCSHTGKTPPCANALIEAGVSRVVIAMQDPNPRVAGQGIQRLRDAGIDVVVGAVGVLETEVRALNSGFIKRMEHRLPWVRVKLGMSLDGRTAMSSGESQWITGEDARADVQRLRASADAILTGSGTVLADDPSLNVRASASELGLHAENDKNHENFEIHQPLRVVLDSALKMSPQSKMLSLEGDTLIYTCSDDANKQQALEKSGAIINQIKPDELGRVPLKPVLQDLAKQQINEVHVEAGATLCGALLQQGLVDEIVLYMAPTIMGANARGLFNIPELDQMKDKIDLTIQDIRAVGNDWRIRILLNS